MTLADALFWVALPFVCTTFLFGFIKGENNYYDSDDYDGNGTAHQKLMRFTNLSQHEREMLIDAIWIRQRCFIAGDRMFREYGEMLDELTKDFDYIPGRYR